MTKANIVRNYVPQEDPDFVTCLKYVLWAHVEHKKSKDFALGQGIDRTTLWRWRQEWIAKGLMDACIALVRNLQIEDINIAQGYVLSEWHDLAVELIRLAKNSSSDYIRLVAIQFIYRDMVRPTLEKQQAGNEKERDFVDLIIRSEGRALDPFLGLLAEEPEDEETRERPASEFESNP
jgi:hypothetical protein